MHDALAILFGLKTTAIFDVWSFEHILSGISVGSAVQHKNHTEVRKLLRTDDHNYHSWYFALLGVLCLAYAWETIEHYLEEGLMGAAVAYWFQGVEFWPNRIISDPLLLILGYCIARKYPTTVWPARALSLLWLVVHVFVFPHSMYLHTLF